MQFLEEDVDGKTVDQRIYEFSVTINGQKKSVNAKGIDQLSDVLDQHSGFKSIKDKNYLIVINSKSYGLSEIQFFRIKHIPLVGHKPANV